MYNTLSNKIPKAPVVGSLFSAEKQIRQWEKSNNLSSFLDKLGSRWDVQLSTKFHPERSEKKWDALIKLSTSLSASDFIRQGVLCQDEDKRTLHFLENHRITIEMKTKIISADNMEELRSMYATWVESTKQQITKSDFLHIKKSMVSKWLEKKMLFG